MIRLSVIVPTRNRRKLLLERSLPAMFTQDMAADEFEIIVVVDGSADGTAQALGELRPPCSLRVMEQPARGASAARNAGIQAARGSLLLFVDDDIICEPDLFRLHAEAHRGARPALVYGSISIHPETPHSLLRCATEAWYEEYYGRLKAQGGLKFLQDNFLISNSSLPRATAIDCGAFDETMAAKEDYEFGLRLWKLGVQFRFLPQARAYEYFLKPLHSLVSKDGRAFGEAEVLLSRKYAEYRPYSRFAAFGKTTWGRRWARRMLVESPVNLAGLLNLPLRACDRLSRFPAMRRAGRHLMEFARSTVEIRSAVRQVGSWKALHREFGATLPVLLYHHVGPERPGTFDGLTVSPAVFERQVRALARHGFKGICPQDWAHWLRDGEGLPNKPILITFDDGYADTAEYALPILRKYGFGAAVFVVTERLGATNTWDEAEGFGTLHLMTAEQIRYWATQGIEFGPHGRTHQHLTQLRAADQCAEIAGSKHDLAALLGHPPVSFAYPYGDVDDTVRDMAKREFQLAFGVEKGLNCLSDDRHLIRRAYIAPRISMFEFALRVQRGGTSRISNWCMTLALRTRLRRALGIKLPRS